jgi:hypothetical protein
LTDHFGAKYEFSPNKVLWHVYLCIMQGTAVGFEKLATAFETKHLYQYLDFGHCLPKCCFSNPLPDDTQVWQLQYRRDD